MRSFLFSLYVCSVNFRIWIKSATHIGHKLSICHEWCIPQNPLYLYLLLDQIFTRPNRPKKSQLRSIRVKIIGQPQIPPNRQPNRTPNQHLSANQSDNLFSGLSIGLPSTSRPAYSYLAGCRPAYLGAYSIAYLPPYDKLSAGHH